VGGAMVDVETRDGIADAYVSRPDVGGRRPGVLFVIDAFGLRPQIEEMADRIAEQGFVVLVPNVFYRVGRTPVVSLEGLGDPARRDEVFGRIRPLINGLTPELAVADGGAYLDWLESEAAGGKFAITGYCMGGRLGWRVAAAHPERVAALGCFHTGGLVTDSADSPHLTAGAVEAELYLGFADQDASMTADQIATLEHALDRAGRDYRSEVYEGAAHGYTMADTPAYDEVAAERHFRELSGLLERAFGA
jgi:carboxymethylenebutenolidase